MKGVSKGFGSGESRTPVLSDINLEVEEGEFVAIVGYSGSGKSTLMNLLSGLLFPDEGSVTVDNEKIKGPSAERGLVFQNYSLLPWLNVGQNVELAVNQVWAKEDRKERDRRIDLALERVNLSLAKHKKPAELSGGMRQRNSVARTLSMTPKVLLLDEPLSALDALTRSVIQDQILEIWEKEKQTIVLITNDVDEGIYMADRIIPMSIGPGATFGPEFPVALPRPRDRRTMLAEPEIVKNRAEIIAYLLDQKEKEKAAIDAPALILPNISPMDISMARPSRFRGMRPLPKKTLK